MVADGTGHPRRDCRHCGYAGVADFAGYAGTGTVLDSPTGRFAIELRDGSGYFARGPSCGLRFPVNGRTSIALGQAA